MNELYLGIELNDKGCSVAWYNADEKMVQIPGSGQGQYMIPGMVSYDTLSGMWQSGQNAEDNLGRPGCIVLGNLLSLFRQQQELKFGSSILTADEVMQHYLEGVLKEIYDILGCAEIRSLTFCIDEIDVWGCDRLKKVMEQSGICAEDIHVLNRTECFGYYMMSQKREKWNNGSLLFSYDEDGLFCYELTAKKSTGPLIAFLKREKIEMAPSCEMLSESSGEYSGEDAAHEADLWFASMAEKKMAGKVINSVVLNGAGFSDYTWCREFLKKIGSLKSRFVFLDYELFEKGAAFASCHLAEKESHFPYMLFCEGRTEAGINLVVDVEDTLSFVNIIPAGVSCSEARGVLDLMLIENSTLRLQVKRFGSLDTQPLSLDLHAFMEDGRERTRVRISMAYVTPDTLVVRAQDLGFGEIFPSSGLTVKQTFRIPR